MQTETYNLKRGKNHTVYYFVSEAVHGSVSKTIQFQLIENGLYNLAFGDSLNDEEDLDDLIVTNNGDTDKVLATVGAAIQYFTNENSTAWVFAKGSTPSRTRLYRMGIQRYLESISEEFEVLGEIEENWEDFRRGVAYTAFAVRRKKY